MIIISCFGDETRRRNLNNQYLSDFKTRKARQYAISVINTRCFKGME